MSITSTRAFSNWRCTYCTFFWFLPAALCCSFPRFLEMLSICCAHVRAITNRSPMTSPWRLQVSPSPDERVQCECCHNPSSKPTGWRSLPPSPTASKIMVRTQPQLQLASDLRLQHVRRRCERGATYSLPRVRCTRNYVETSIGLVQTLPRVPCDLPGFCTESHTLPITTSSSCQQMIPVRITYLRLAVFLTNLRTSFARTAAGAVACSLHAACSRWPGSQLAQRGPHPLQRSGVAFRASCACLL